MQNNFAEDGSPTSIHGARGAVYKISADGEVVKLTSDQFAIPNTMAWTSSGGFLIADTTQNAIYRYRVADDGRSISDRVAFGGPFSRGLPDGSCLDVEGFSWNCRVVGGACLARFTPDGNLDRIVELPCSWPTELHVWGFGPRYTLCDIRPFHHVGRPPSPESP
jgi:sugar lactone lactonase YvrE